MTPAIRFTTFVLLGMLVLAQVVRPSNILAQGFSPEMQKKHDELLESARTKQMLGNIFVATGVTVIVGGIALKVYRDRKKIQPPPSSSGTEADGKP